MRLGNAACTQDGGVLYVLYLNNPTTTVRLGPLVLSTSRAANSVIAKLGATGVWEWARAFDSTNVTIKCIAANARDLVIGCDMSPRTQSQTVKWDSFDLSLTNKNRHSFVIRVSLQTGQPLAGPTALQTEGPSPTFPYCSIDSVSLNANGQVSVGGAIAFASDSHAVTFGAYNTNALKSRGVRMAAPTGKHFTRLPLLASLQPDLSCEWAGYLSITDITESKTNWTDADPMHHGTFNAVVRTYNGETFAAGRLAGTHSSQQPNGAKVTWFHFSPMNSMTKDSLPVSGYIWNTFVIGKFDSNGRLTAAQWDPAEINSGILGGESFASDLCVTSTKVYVVGGFRGSNFELCGGSYPGNTTGTDDAKQLGFVLQLGRDGLQVSNVCYVVQFDYQASTLSGMATLTSVIAPEGSESVYITGLTKGSSLWFGHHPMWKNNQPERFYDANRYTPFLAELSAECDSIKRIWAPAMTECSGQAAFFGRNQGDYNFTGFRECRLSYDAARDRIWWGGCANGGSLAFGFREAEPLLTRADFSREPGVYVTGVNTRPGAEDWLRQVTLTYKSRIPQSPIVQDDAGLAWVPTNRSYVACDVPANVVVPYELYTDYMRTDGAVDRSVERVYKALYRSGEVLPSGFTRPNTPRKRYRFINYQEVDTGTAGNNNVFLVVPDRDREIQLNYQVDYAFDAVASVTNSGSGDLLKPEELSVLGNPTYATDSGLDENLDVGTRDAPGSTNPNNWHWGRTWIGEGERVQIEIDTGTEGQPFGERFIVHRFNGSGDANAPDSGGVKDFTSKLSTTTFVMTGPMDFEIIWKKQIAVRFGPMPDSMGGAKDAVFVLDQVRTQVATRSMGSKEFDCDFQWNGVLSFTEGPWPLSISTITVALLRYDSWLDELVQTAHFSPDPHRLERNDQSRSFSFYAEDVVAIKSNGYDSMQITVCYDYDVHSTRGNSDWLYPYTGLSQNETPEKWYDYGSRLWIGASDIAASDRLRLSGWLSAGGHFPKSRCIANELNALLEKGGPEPVYYHDNILWLTNYHALNVTSLVKPTFVTWDYGATVYTTYLALGQTFDPLGHTNLFDDSKRVDGSGKFKAAEPTIAVVEGAPAGTTGGDGVLWDDVAKKLVPIRPGRYLATFMAANLTATTPVAVMLDFAVGFPTDYVTNIMAEPPSAWGSNAVRFPKSGRSDYPRADFRHIAGAPAVDLDASTTDKFAFLGPTYLYFASNRGGRETNVSQLTSVSGAQVQDGKFTCTLEGRSVLVFSRSVDDDLDSSPATGNRDRESLVVKVVETKDATCTGAGGWQSGGLIQPNSNRVDIGSPIESSSDTAGLRTGWVLFNSPRLLINPRIYDRDGPSGPIIPVNRRLVPESNTNDELVVVWYENPGKTSSQMPNIAWPYQPVLYSCTNFTIRGDADLYYTGFKEHRPFPERLVTNHHARIIYTSSRLGSEGLRFNGTEWEQQPITNQFGLFSQRFQNVQVYSQPDPKAQGYNPNEEHAFIAPAGFHHPYNEDGEPLAAEIDSGAGTDSPSAVFALRDDLNFSKRQWCTGTNNSTEQAVFGEIAADRAKLYTSEPMVLVQYFDTDLRQYRMGVYFIGHECDIYHYEYPATAGQLLQAPYPVNRLTGLKGCNDSNQKDNDPARDATIDGTYYYNDVTGQATFWLDTLGNAWAISGPVAVPGGYTAPHLVAGFYYAKQPDFWTPPAPDYREERSAFFWAPEEDVPAGGFIPWLPGFTNSVSATFSVENSVLGTNVPTPIRYNTTWPKDVPILKIGETLTHPGGEFKADFPIRASTEEIVERLPILRPEKGVVSSILVTNSQVVTNGQRLLQVGFGSNVVVTLTAQLGTNSGVIKDISCGRGQATTNNEVFMKVSHAGDAGTVIDSIMLPDLTRIAVASTNKVGNSVKLDDPVFTCIKNRGTNGAATIVITSTVDGKLSKLASQDQVLRAGDILLAVERPITSTTPGLPGIIGWKAGQILFDSRNYTMKSSYLYPGNYCARLINPLLTRKVALQKSAVSLQFQGAGIDFSPANKSKIRIESGKWRFVDLSASLQRRIYFDPLTEELALQGYVSGRTYGDHDLTASPDPVYVVEPNILTANEATELRDYFRTPSGQNSEIWRTKIVRLYNLSRDPNGLEKDTTIISTDEPPSYLVGLATNLLPNELTGFPGSLYHDQSGLTLEAAFGPGLALVPNADLLNPHPALPFTEGYVTLVENAHPSDPTLSPVTLHIIKLDSRFRYRGAIKTLVSPNVFDEKILLAHTGDFGGNSDDLRFDWWYMAAKNGDVGTPEVNLTNQNALAQSSYWKLFGGETNRQLLLAGDPSKLLGDNLFFVRYRHKDEPADRPAFPVTSSTEQADWVKWTDSSHGSFSNRFPWEWAGAGNSPQIQADSSRRYLPQLVMGWVKRVLDRVNPYEARFSDFYNNESPATYSSMIQVAGSPYVGDVALNPDKDVVENVGLIELYQTVLNRARKLSIEADQPNEDYSIWQALLLAATRLNQLYSVLGDEAYADAQDPTIGIKTSDVDYGRLAPAMFAFQNLQKTPLDEELALLRGTDYGMGRPVYNRLFWNFVKGAGEPAYVMNYGIKDVNSDGFIDESDAKIMYPQGHGDAWGYYLSASQAQYALLRHPNFSWQSFAELYNLFDLVLEVDYADEVAFARTAAARARTGLAIVRDNYRRHYDEDPAGQWQGYPDTDAARAWGVSEWGTRACQAAYCDWLVANWLLPYRAYPTTETTASGGTKDFLVNFDLRSGDKLNVYENGQSRTLNIDYTLAPITNRFLVRFNEAPLSNTVVRIERARPTDDSADQLGQIERCSVSELAEIAVNASTIQHTIDQANNGLNPLGLTSDSVTFDIGTAESIGFEGMSHFQQIYERALKAAKNALTTYDYANDLDNRLRSVAESTEKSRLAAEDQNRSYRNQLIDIFGTPYENLIGPGGLYPPGYDGPDLLLYEFVPYTSVSSFLPDVPDAFKSLFEYTFAGIQEGGEFELNWAENNVFKLYLHEGFSLEQLITNYVHLDVSMDTNLSTFYDRFAAGANFTIRAPNGQAIMLKQAQSASASVGYTADESWGERRAQGQIQQKLLALVQARTDLAKALDDYEGYLRVLQSKIIARQSAAKDFASEFVEEQVMDAIRAVKSAIIGFAKLTNTALQHSSDSAEENFKAAEKLAMPILGMATDAVGVPAEAAIMAACAISELSFDAAQLAIESVGDSLDWGLKVEEDLYALEKKAYTYEGETRQFVLDLIATLSQESTLRYAIASAMSKVTQAEQDYQASVVKGFALVAERETMNKRVAAAAQQNRYADMTLRVSRNTALQQFNSAFELLARYAYLAGKAYDYETNLDPSDPASVVPILSELIRARSLGLWAEGEPAMGQGGIAECLAKMKANFDVLQGQLGINHPQTETITFSLRQEWARIKPGTNDLGSSDARWRKVLQSYRVPNLYQVPDFKRLCRSFSNPANGPEPGLVIPLSTEINAGKNFFGWPLGGGDQSFDPSQYSTRFSGVGVVFPGYDATTLAGTPRVYFVPAGQDVMRIPNSTALETRGWNVLDQKIPVPYPVQPANLSNPDWFISQDSLDGSFAEIRKFSALRAYAEEAEDQDDNRLYGRSVWNTKWLLIIPGRYLSADADAGLDAFVGSEESAGILDIQLVFNTYSYSGN